MYKMRVAYVWDEQLIEECIRLPAVVGRAHLVHNLIEAYNLIKKMKIVRSSLASYEDLKCFHSEPYLEQLKKMQDVEDDYMTSEQDELYGIGYDCPPVSNMFKMVSTIAGGSITAAKCLTMDVADVVINWCGGWHHAHKNGAEGFCYINDIVIAIEKLKNKFKKVLYIDLDVHHGNGVQDAYSNSKTVFTLSFHKFEPGFYPGTGDIDDIGSGDGKGYSCNFPLHEAYTDSTIEFAFEKVFSSVFSYFAPDAIVVQCGADALSHDPHGGACLTTCGYSYCIKTVLDKRKPMMILGGGGYNHTNTARLWTTLTALIVGEELDEVIPEHNEWPEYGPDYMLPIQPTLTRDTNKKDYLEDCINKIKVHVQTYLSKNETHQPTLKKQKTEDLRKEMCYKKGCSYIPKYNNIQNPKTCDKDVDVYDFVE